MCLGVKSVCGRGYKSMLRYAVERRSEEETTRSRFRPVCARAQAGLSARYKDRSDDREREVAMDSPP